MGKVRIEGVSQTDCTPQYFLESPDIHDVIRVPKWSFEPKMSPYKGSVNGKDGDTAAARGGRSERPQNETRKACLLD